MSVRRRRGACMVATQMHHGEWQKSIRCSRTDAKRQLPCFGSKDCQIQASRIVRWADSWGKTSSTGHVEPSDFSQTLTSSFILYTKRSRSFICLSINVTPVLQEYFLYMSLVGCHSPIIYLLLCDLIDICGCIHWKIFWRYKPFEY